MDKLTRSEKLSVDEILRQYFSVQTYSDLRDLITKLEAIAQDAELEMMNDPTNHILNSERS